VYSMLLVSLDCPFAVCIAGSQDVIFVMCFVYSMLLVSLGCPFAVCIAGMLRRNIRSLHCVLNVASFSRLSICCLYCRYVKR
jgi:hypothetical protein